MRHLCTGFQYDDETDELRQNNDGEDVEEEEEGEELFGDEMERLVLSTWQRQHTNDGLPERDCPYFERHALIHHPTINPQHQPLEKLNTKRCPSPPLFFFFLFFFFVCRDYRAIPALDVYDPNMLDETEQRELSLASSSCPFHHLFALFSLLTHARPRTHPDLRALLAFSHLFFFGGGVVVCLLFVLVWMGLQAARSRVEQQLAKRDADEAMRIRGRTRLPAGLGFGGALPPNHTYAHTHTHSHTFASALAPTHPLILNTQLLDDEEEDTGELPRRRRRIAERSARTAEGEEGAAEGEDLEYVRQHT